MYLAFSNSNIGLSRERGGLLKVFLIRLIIALWVTDLGQDKVLLIQDVVADTSQVSVPVAICQRFRLHAGGNNDGGLN